MKQLLPVFICIFAWAAPRSYAQDVLSSPDAKDFLNPSITASIAGGPYKVKTVSAREYQVLPAGSKKEAGNAEYFEFNESGHLKRIIEIERNDTAEVRDFHYADGLLTKELIDYKAWDRRYRASYRFTGNRDLYQVKSFELLSGESTMLLDTWQYKYNAQGQREMAWCMAGNTVDKSLFFSYDNAGRLKQETLKTGDNELMWVISYSYNAAGLLIRVNKRDYQQGNRSHDFIYSYNSAGELSEIQWIEDGIGRGNVSYSYDEKGVLSSITRNVSNSPRTVKVFEYVYY